MVYHKDSEIPKGEVWTLLADKAIGFALWMHAAASENAIVVKTIFDSLHCVDLSSPLFANIMNILLAENVIEQVDIDRCNARLAELQQVPSFHG